MSRFILAAAASTTIFAGCDERTPPASASPRIPSPSPTPNASPPVITPDTDPVVASLRAAGVSTPVLRAVLQTPTRRILGFDVAPEDALPHWKRLRAATERTGLYPVILDWEQDTLEDAFSLNDPEARPEQILAAAAQIECPAWFNKRRESDSEYYDGVEIGEWPATAAGMSSESIPHDVSEKEGRTVTVVLVPTRNCWEVCAILPYGGWNECPWPAEHLAVQRYWNQKWGAEIAYMSGDVLQFVVPRRPATRDEAMVLAREQFIYSGGDLVYQGVETMSNLAASLMTDAPWFFWWD
jgi:hypothetical protein